MFWWSTAALAIYDVAPVSERMIAWALLGGVALGGAIDFVCLHRWIAAFYTARWSMLVPLYLACSVLAVASCMGLPLANLALGTLAGLYAGRRARHAAARTEEAHRLARRVAFFTMTVTGLEAFAIGLLALSDREALRLLASITGTTGTTVPSSLDFGIVAALAAIVAAFQFVCTRTAARVAGGLGSRRENAAPG
jgi:hypothetical protein